MTTLSTDPLLQPFSILNLTLRNRVVSTSHEPAYAVDGMPKDRYRLYHAEKAKGGVGLTMIGGSAVVAPDSPPAFGNLEVYRDEIVPWFQRLADDVHGHGAAVMCQITHLGRRSSNYTADWLPLVAPSGLKERAHRANPKQAESWDLARIVAAYAAAAQRCQAGGLDGIEIEAYGHLFDAFLSPATNHRDDEWGGSFENRLRFPGQVVRAVRAAVGPDFPVGLRLAVTDDLRGGLGRDEGLAAARRLIADGIDFVSVIRGHIDTDEGLTRVIPPMGRPSAPHLDFTGGVRRALDVPIMHAARIADVATARHAVRAGLVDLVGMTRAQIADPHLVNKIAAGQEDRIRPCVGAAYCLDAIYQDGEAKCVHNPSTGRETLLPHLVLPGTGPARRAVVVGAGPAGLEAARVLAERGHRVTLLEAAPAAGGQLLLASRAPARRDLIGIIDWRVAECRRLDVTLRLNTWAEAADVLALRPDVVIVATGGRPDTSFLDSGSGSASGSGAASGSGLVIDAWDVLDGSAVPRGDVLLYDDNGGHAGLDAARALLDGSGPPGGSGSGSGSGPEVPDRGLRLEYVTPERTLGPDLGGMNYPLYAAVLAEADVRTTLLHSLREVRRRPDGRLEAVLHSEHAARNLVRVVDAVVVERGTVPNDGLYFDLVEGSLNGGEVDQDALLSLKTQDVRRTGEPGYQLFRIGDAVSSRNVHAAVYDAFRLCLPI